MFRTKRFKYITIEEMNEVLDGLKGFVKMKYVDGPFDEYGDNDHTTYIEEKVSELHITAKWPNKMNTYVCMLDGVDKVNIPTGMVAYNTLSKYAKVQKYYKTKEEADNGKVGSAKPLLYKNMKYAGKRVKAWGYDLNSAYSMMLLEPLPNIETLQEYTEVKEGQIGFIEQADGGLDITFEVGEYCDYVCDLMPSPYERFVKTWYSKKKNAKNPEDKARAKAMLNFSIGYTQNVNPFFRATIVGRCNLFIKGLMDENTIYCNTDSIISAVRRPDLEENLGLEVGQWKLEHDGEMFAWDKDKLNYQWNDDYPIARGVPKGWWVEFEKKNKRKFDILVDEYPHNLNKYYFNRELLEITEVAYE